MTNRGPGQKISDEERDAIEERVIELALAGATYREISDTLGLSAPTIRRIRTRHHLPKPARNRRPPVARTLAEAFYYHTRTSADGHVHWTGPYSGRMPTLSAQGGHYNARRIAFRTHHDRDPTGPLRRTCTAPDCIAGAHHTDQTIRDLDATYHAIFGQTP